MGKGQISIFESNKYELESIMNATQTKFTKALPSPEK